MSQRTARSVESSPPFKFKGGEREIYIYIYILSVPCMLHDLFFCTRLSSRMLIVMSTDCKTPRYIMYLNFI
jgi:hypothetical protein